VFFGIQDSDPMPRSPLDRLLRTSIRGLGAPVYPAPSRGALQMDANTSLFGANPVLHDVARQVDRLSLNQYPSGNSDPLRDAIAEARGVRRENVVVGNGSDELFDLVMKAFVNSGDRVAFPVPSFVMYPFYGGVNFGRLAPVPLKAGAGFALDVDGILRARAKVTVIASPNSPTGNAFPPDALAAVLRRSKGIVVIDEAYAEFCGQDLLRQAAGHPRLVVTRTFSKAYALAGLRIGYAVGSRAAIDALLRVKPPFNVGTFAEAAALAALKNRRFVEHVVGVIRAERVRVAAALRDLGARPHPSDANFLLVDTGRPSGAVAGDLRERGILVRQMSDWPGLETCIRVTLGPPETNDRFLRALKSVFA
jgi:histidinol-phosphate aminotransferase